MKLTVRKKNLEPEAYWYLRLGEQKWEDRRLFNLPTYLRGNWSYTPALMEHLDLHPTLWNQSIQNQKSHFV